MAEAESLSFQASLSVVGALERVVRRCVGPDGGSVLFTKNTGETLITRHGHRILTTLHLDHPMARMVLECVCAHDRVTADGSKSFILLLAALLREIRDSAHRCRTVSWSPATPRKLANQLLSFCWTELDDVIAHGVVPNALLLLDVGRDGLEGEVLPALVAGYVAGRAGDGQAGVLTSRLCELYSKVSREQGSSTADTAEFLHSNFRMLHAKVSGLPLGSSQVVEGLVMARDWSVWREADGPVRALVVWERLDQPWLACEDLRICLEQDWLLRSESVMTERLARFQGLQVSVLLTGVKQPECVLEWARLSGVSVLECCDSEQLDLLCEVADAEMLPMQPWLRVCTLNSCSRLQLGGSRYALLGLPPHGALLTHTLVLCAPTPGQLEQAVCVGQGLFTMLRHLSRSVFRKREQSRDTHSLNDSHTHQIEGGGVSPAHGRLHMSAPLPDRPQGFDPERPQGSVKDVWEGVLHSGGVVPVGGAFELLLHHSLLHCSNHGDAETRRLLAEAVLSVPRALHSHRPRSFLQHHADFVSKLRTLKQGRTLGDPRSRSELRFGPGPAGSGPSRIEPICSKHQLVVSVLQCVNRLLCVGTILHTRTPVHKPLAAALEDSDQEDSHRGGKSGKPGNLQTHFPVMEN